MSKLALVLFVSATAAACTDEAPFPGESGSGEPIAMREWRAELQARDVVPQGSVTVQTNLEAEAFTATIVLRGDLPQQVRFWFVRTGSCDLRGAIVGETMAYPYLTIGDDGTASSSSIVFAAYDPDAVHNAVVQDAEGNVIACGNFIEQMFQPEL